MGRMKEGMMALKSEFSRVKGERDYLQAELTNTRRQLSKRRRKGV
jgi:hypothetical protein